MIQQVPDHYGFEVSVWFLQAMGHAVAVKKIELVEEDDLLVRRLAAHKSCR